MTQRKYNNENHSEKVQQVIGSIPSSLERWGIITILIISIILLLVLFLFPYPHSNGESIITHLFYLFDK